MSRQALAIVGLTVVAAALAAQFHSIRSLRADLAEMREEIAGAPGPETGSESRRSALPAASAPSPRFTGANADVSRRLATLEEIIAQLTDASEYLMDRGQIPPTQEKLEEYRRTFLDSNASSRDRLTALRLLRRNDGMTDDVLLAAAAWLSDTSEPETTRNLLEALTGLSDLTLLNPTMQLASSEDRGLRERAIRNLRAFVSDPQVEALLWNIASNDPSGDIRRRAADALVRAPVNEERVAALRQRALDADTSMSLRTLTLRALQAGQVDFTDVATALAQSSHQTQDKSEHLRYLQLFDDVNHPAFIPSLVQSVQSSDADIRRRATDALIDYRNDPIVRQWLEYLAESDPDPRVRDEANRFRRGGAPSRR